MNSSEALVALNMIPDIGSVRLAKLLEVFGEPEHIFQAPYEKLLGAGRIGPQIASRIVSFEKQTLNKEIKSAEKHGLKIITLLDCDYPERLKNIPGAPIALYVKGSLKEEDKYSISIVGSRRASYYGMANAKKFSAELSERGLTVVSGMARGIDAQAHKGALSTGGRTIAVMGSGFNHIYPQENKELAGEIAKNGAVISEFCVDTRPLRQNFPRRNRVISGLSLGVLVVEACRNSGAIITADFALEQGREVFALPGKVDSPNSSGTNDLIKQGAKLCSCVDDILEEFDTFLVAAQKNKKRPSGALETCSAGRLFAEAGAETGEESRLFGLLKNEPICMDELVEKSDMDIVKLSDILLRLVMKRLVKQLPGKQFARV